MLLLGAAALIGEEADTAPLLGWLWRLGLVLAIWFLGWPLVETVRRRTRQPA